MRPYYFVDQLELELKNLDIKDTVDNVMTNIQVTRRNKKYSKRLFLRGGVWYIRRLHMKRKMPYYKEKAKKT